MSAKIRSEMGDMIVAMRDISYSVIKSKDDMIKSKDDMKTSWKDIKDLCDSLMDKILLLSRRVLALETESEYLRGQIKDFEDMSYIGSKDFIDTQIDSIVKPLEVRLLTRITKIEDKYNTSSCVQDVLSTTEISSKGKENSVSDGSERGNRIIIEGVPNDLEPLEIINELASVLEIPDMSNKKISYVKQWISGLGTEHARVILRVCFNNVNDKNKFLSKELIKKLKNIESSNRFHGVKIYPDRSYAEREHFKLLLNEAKRKNVVLKEGGVNKHIWIVSRGMVIKVKKRHTVDM